MPGINSNSMAGNKVKILKTVLYSIIDKNCFSNFTWSGKTTHGKTKHAMKNYPAILNLLHCIVKGSDSSYTYSLFLQNLKEKIIKYAYEYAEKQKDVNDETIIEITCDKNGAFHSLEAIVPSSNDINNNENFTRVIQQKTQEQREDTITMGPINAYNQTTAVNLTSNNSRRVESITAENSNGNCSSTEPEKGVMPGNYLISLKQEMNSLMEDFFTK